MCREFWGNAIKGGGIALIEVMKRCIYIGILAAMLVCGGQAEARRFNDKVENRPYADMRKWHLGFSIGMQASDLRFTHNGYITENGEQWRMEQADYQPGFVVTGLLDIRLSKYFSLRWSPGMMFTSRNVTFYEVGSGAEERQNIKSTYVVMPIDIKYSSMRVRNARPYVLAGVMPSFDVSKKNSDLLKVSSTDFYITVGFGCDFYLPYFKFIPEVKFCFGLSDVLTHDRPDLADDPTRMKFTNSLSKATSKMIVFTFYFE